MIIQKTKAILAIYLSLALLFTSLAASAAIPPRSIALHSSKDTSPPAALTPQRLSKRTPSYFPETVPDAAEIKDRLTSLREAGFVPSSHPQQQEETQFQPDANAEIDTRTRARIHSSPLSHMGMDMDMGGLAPAPLLALAFFVFAASLACVATIIQKMRAR